jgi:hypothetical protein
MTSYTESGQFFFHYTTREAAFTHILPERRLRLSPYSRMRDPLEAKAPAVASGLAVPEDPAAQDEMGRAFFEARDEIARLRRQTKLLSLTVDAHGYDDEYIADFGRGWARARMWEQYSEQHQGVCLLFRRETFEPLLLTQLRERSPGACAGAVRYSEAGLATSSATTLLQREGVTGTSLAQEHVRRFAKEFFFSKLIDWESEHEYRFIEPGDDEEYSYVDIGDTLISVIVGHAFPRWQEPAARTICHRAGLDLRQMSWEYYNRPMLLNVKT